MSYKHILVTGGAGFIGSNFVRLALQREPSIALTNLDLLTYSGNRASLADIETRFGAGPAPRYRFVQGDINDADLVARLLAAHEGDPRVDAVVHFAAESHVDRSILGPMPFVRTNVQGTVALLEACRSSLDAQPRRFRFVHVSTDEVYGSLGADDPAFVEDLPLLPNSPYAATKAASDLMVRAYHETYRFPAVTTRCSNNYGHYQYPEKLVPLMLTRAMSDAELPVYGDGLNVRDWIFVGDHCDGIWSALQRGVDGGVYNLGGERELSNLELVHALLDALGKPRSLIRHVADRQGHDRRYAMNVDRARSVLGWRPQTRFEDGLLSTVRWYQANRSWWMPLLDESQRLTAAMYRA